MSSDLVGYGEPSHDPVDGYRGLVPDLCLRDEDDEALNPGDAVSLPRYVLNLHFIRLSSFYWRRACESTTGEGSSIVPVHSFHIHLRKTVKTASHIGCQQLGAI